MITQFGQVFSNLSRGNALICKALICNHFLYAVAMPNSSGAPVLDDTRSLQGVHIGTSYHLDKTHAHNQVCISFDVLVISALILVLSE